MFKKIHSGYCGFCFGIIVFLSGCHICWSQDFGYDGNKGPSHWGEQYNECTGKHQSPINIDLLRVKRVVLPTLKMNGFELPPEKTTLKNNGHTVMITIDSDMKPSISGGPISGDYEFAQFHFHWGDNDTVGSEDLIDGRSFPMELHMVFFNKQYLNVQNAMNHPDGLSVLAFFYDVGETNNKNYNQFSEVLSLVVNPNTNATFNQKSSLLDLMPKDLEHYFSYNGSLTTPPCSEIVTWIDFQEPIMLSTDQITKFRALLGEDGHVLTHNFRPIQPLGDRVILFNINDKDDNSLDHLDADQNIPHSLDDIPNDLDSSDEFGKTNDLNDLTDNNLDSTEKEKKPKSASMVHLISMHLLPLSILTLSMCRLRY